jgi:hypothetical protein
VGVSGATVLGLLWSSRSGNILREPDFAIKLSEITFTPAPGLYYYDLNLAALPVENETLLFHIVTTDASVVNKAEIRTFYVYGEEEDSTLSTLADMKTKLLDIEDRISALTQEVMTRG